MLQVGRTQEQRCDVCRGVVEWNGCGGWFGDAEDWSVAWAMGMGGAGVWVS